MTLSTSNDGDSVDAGSGDTIAGYTIAADGTFYWKVVYDPGSDTNNTGVTSGCSAEQVDVDIAPLAA